MIRKIFLTGSLYLCLSVTLLSCSKFKDFLHSQNGNETSQLYLISNDSVSNQVWMFAQHPNGHLELKEKVSTGGSGTGNGLGSQGSVAINKSGNWLYAVNAGDNSISSFKISEDGMLTLHQTINSGGMTPLSIDVYDHLLYVVNGGGSICGFDISSSGDLTKIEGSEKPLSEMAAGPAQITFRSAGKMLVVTEKNTNSIVTFKLDDSGVPSNFEKQSAEAETPFGFAFSGRNTMVVTDAFGGRPSESKITSYTFDDNGMASLTSSVTTYQTAACWIALNKPGNLGFVTNTGSSTISSIKIESSGELELVDSVAGKTGDTPIDIAVSDRQKFVYALSQKSQLISEFSYSEDGKLDHIGDENGLPAAASGMAIR